MNLNNKYNLKDFELVTLKPYAYRLFKNNSNIFLMEITCGSHGLWEMWIKLTPEETFLYQNEGNIGLGKISKLLSDTHNNSNYYLRNILVNK